MATHLSPDEMKLFVRGHFEEFVNKRNLSIIWQNLTPDFLDHDGPGGKPAGIKANEALMTAMHAQGPDLEVIIEDMVAEGDKVMCRNVWRWTDASTGRPMGFHGFVLWRFEGGKIAERWATVTRPAEIPL